MKKQCLALAAALVLLLCSCAGAPAEKSGAVTVEVLPAAAADETDAQPQFAVHTLDSVRWRGWWGEICSDGYNIYRIAVRSSEILEEERKERWLLLRSNPETLKEEPLCSVPECTHDSPACPAFLAEPCSIACIGEKLYIRRSVGGIDAAQPDAPCGFLDCIDPDTGARRRIAGYPAGLEIGEESYTDGSGLFCRCYNHNTNRDGTIRTDLETGEITMYPDTGILDVWQDQFLIERQKQQLPYRILPQAAHAQDYNLNHIGGDAGEMELYLFDPETGVRTLLDTRPAWMAQNGVRYAAAVVDDYFYELIFRNQDAQGLYADVSAERMDLHTGVSECVWEKHIRTTGFWISIAASDQRPPLSEEPYWTIGQWNRQTGRDEYEMIDRKTGEIHKVTPRFAKGNWGIDAATPSLLLNDGRWVVPIEEINPNDYGAHFVYGIIGQDTLFAPYDPETGYPDVQRIESWLPPEPLG